jgi:hypothetical protein
MLDHQESATLTLTNYSWDDGKALFKWSDGTVYEVRCSLAQALERSAHIVDGDACELH